MDQGIVETIGGSFRELWAAVAQFAPEMVTALLVLIVGWILAGWLKLIIERIFKRLKVNEALDKAGVDKITDKAGVPLRAGVFVGTLVKWFVILAFFVAALDILGLTEVTLFVRDVILGYLPRVIVAVLMLLVAVIVADIAGGAVATAVKATNTGHAEFFGKLTHWAIVVFAVLAALNQLQIAPELIQTLFMGIVFALSLALGLSFGFGGRDAAARFINNMTSRRSDH